MTDKTEFEEKEYEQPLNHQLLMSSNNIWSPGQVFEKFFGVDAALFTTHLKFWNLFGFPTIPTGIALDKFKINFLIRIMKSTLKKFPSFNINLLIQAKRPSYRHGVNAKYAKHGIKAHYWQFRITYHQQKILEKLEEIFNKNALVTYACAAFHKFEDLDNYIQNGLLVDNSTFVNPSILKSHSKWVYDQPGNIGLACSEIKEQYGKTFKEQLETLYSLSENETEPSKEYVIKNLKQLEEISINICNESKEINPIAKAYLRRIDKIETLIQEFGIRNDKQAIKSYVSFDLFVSLLNLNWWLI